jgi:hypothetical protein
VWPPFASCSAIHLLCIVDQGVDCGMLSHSSMAVRSCWILVRTGTFSFQDPCEMLPCIIMLKHKVMVADECHANGPQDLMVSLHWNCHRLIREAHTSPVAIEAEHLPTKVDYTSQVWTPTHWSIFLYWRYATDHFLQWKHESKLAFHHRLHWKRAHCSC